MSHPHRSTVRALLTAAAVTALVACADPPPRDADPVEGDVRVPKVLLVGIDGVRPDVLAEVVTPNLDALAADGMFIAVARTTFPSVSGPAWSSMLTGVWPDKHGVTNNDFTGKRFDEYPDFLTRLERVRPELSTAAIVDWLPLVRLDAGTPTIGDDVDVKHELDGYESGWPEADARSADLAVEILTASDPDALFLYLGNPDETSHEHGSIGAEYRAAIELADGHVGLVVDALRARPDYGREDWLILSSTDHGRRSDGGHGGDSPEEMTTWVLLSGAGAGAPLPDSTFIVDVAATALAWLGVAIRPEWGIDGLSLLGR